MSNRQQIAVRKTAVICRNNQERTATQKLLNTAKDRQLKKTVQKYICQLKTNYYCISDLLLSDSFSELFSCSESLLSVFFFFFFFFRTFFFFRILIVWLFFRIFFLFQNFYCLIYLYREKIYRQKCYKTIYK